MTLILAWQEERAPRDRCAAISSRSTSARRRDATSMLTEPMSRKRFLRETVEKLRGEKARRRLRSPGRRRGGCSKRRSMSTTGAKLRRRASSPSTRAARRAAAGRAETRSSGRRSPLEDERAARRATAPSSPRTWSPTRRSPTGSARGASATIGLAYDLLADDRHAQGQPRDEYIAQRRQWADEAQPAALRLTLVREQEQRASALWVPGAAGALGGAARTTRRSGRSRCEESPLGGAAGRAADGDADQRGDRAPLVLDGLHHAARPRRIGSGRSRASATRALSSQALTIEELQKRIDEAHDAAEAAARIAPADPAIHRRRRRCAQSPATSASRCAIVTR